MTNKSIKGVPYIVVLLVLILFAYLEGTTTTDTLSVSITPQLNDGERIIGFAGTVIEASVVSIPKIPIGWDLQISHSFLWKTELKASIAVGAAALEGTELNYFTDFFRIRRKTLNPDFNIEVDVVAQDSKEQVRRIHFKKEQIVLTPLDKTNRGN
jgi:hypothetical protein